MPVREVADEVRRNNVISPCSPTYPAVKSFGAEQVNVLELIVIPKHLKRTIRSVSQRSVMEDAPLREPRFQLLYGRQVLEAHLVKGPHPFALRLQGAH